MAISIRTNIRTARDDADAVTFTAADSSVRNNARILTLGDRADAVRGDGDMLSVVNSGRIDSRGDGAAGIKLSGDGARVVNDGVIEIGGAAIFDPNGEQAPIYADAISVEGDRFDLFNRGTIRLSGSDNSGITGIGDGGSVRNAGAIFADGDFALGAGASGGGSRVFNDGLMSLSGFATIGLFAFGGAGNRLVNGGTIAIAGDGGTAVFVTGDGARLNNHGSISLDGTGVYGLFATGGDATMVNTGSILIASGARPESGAIASVGLISIGAGALIANAGSIRTTGRFGIGMQGVDENALSNSGMIETAGDTSAGIRVGVTSPDAVAAGDVTVENNGVIRTGGDGSVGVLMVGDNNIFRNAGQIETSGGVSMEGILGALPAAGVAANGDRLLIVNATSGVIAARGDGVAAVMLNALEVRDMPVKGASAALSNYGTIEGDVAVLGGNGDERVRNAGRLVGDVQFGDGDDAFVAARGGTLDGALTLGSGDDLVVFKRGANALEILDFAAGEAGGDRIDLSALGIRNFGELQLLASQVGDDTVLRFSASDMVTLRDVALDTLQPADFVFG